MSLTAKLALSQIKNQKNRTIATILGIVLSTAMLTAVSGFVASARSMVAQVLEGASDPERYNQALFVMGCILGSIIMLASIIVVSNAFRVSAGERIAQFGILKSVGATGKQIQKTVLWEAVFLSAVGIPGGLLLGLLVEYTGVSALQNLLAFLREDDVAGASAPLNISFTVTWWMLVAAIATAFITVLLSAYFPAKKAAAIPAIQAIRATGEIKVSRKRVKTSPLIQKIFGFEGTLAAKSLRRNRRAFRATVVSLTISIILLVASGGFDGVMVSTVNAVFPQMKGNVIVQSDLYPEDTVAQIVDELEKLGYHTEVTAIDSTKNTLTIQVQTDAPGTVAKQAEEILKKYPNATGNYQNIMNVDLLNRQTKLLSQTIMLFIYGFSVMLTLIAVTGAVSTISTNVKSRAREFAVLESVGMTKEGIRKMLNLESVMCSLRSLTVGLPIGILLAFFIYKAMGIARNVPFQFPWLAVLECVLGVFIVTWITMRAAAGKLKKNSIIETIRGE